MSGRRRWLRVLVVVVCVGVGAYVLSGSEQQLLQAVDALSDLRPSWLVLGIAAEVASYLCIGGGLSRLLGGRPGVGVAAAIGVSAQGAANCLPAGAAVSGVVTYRQLRRRGAPAQRTISAVLLLSVLQAAALPLLALVGEQLASGQEPIPGLRALSAVVLGVLVAVALALVAFRDHRLPARSLALVGAAEVRARATLARLAARGRRPSPAAPVESGLARLAAVPFGRAALLVASVLSTGYWLADALCLAFSFLAVGGSVPWGGLLVTYSAAQLASLLPFTPGGLGVVEGSLTVGLVAYGGSSTLTLSAVLLYRLISFWGLLPAGAAAWLMLRRSEPLPRRPEPVPAGELA